MNLIAIGRISGRPEAALFDRYSVRLRPKLTVIELAQARGDALVIRRKEAAALLAALPKGGFVVPLDLAGEALNSEAFAAHLLRWFGLSRPITFLIGGTEGLDPDIMKSADFMLSLGSLTWPHFLVRVMLAEQLYRAQTIIQGHPYHRGDRA